MKTSKHIVILFMAADPSDVTRLRLGQELRDVQISLMRSKYRDIIHLKERLSVRPQDISQAIFETEPKIVHFSGHGLDTGELCFENDLGTLQAIDNEALSSLFELTSDYVQCVLFNTCYSEQQAKEIVKYVPFSIGMDHAIGDQAAIAFSTGFYKALGAGHSIEKSFKFGCTEIRLMSFSDYLIPKLFAQEPVGANTIVSEKWTLVLNGTVNDETKTQVEAIVNHLCGLLGDSSLTIKKIEQGSIKVFLEGGRDEFEIFKDLFESGRLTELLGIQIQDVQKTPLENQAADENDQIETIDQQEQLKILFVDDELDNLELLYRTFRRNYRVYRASSGRDALNCLKQHGEMAIIVADQRMPKMSGTEFLNCTVGDYPDTIRIVLSGYTDVEDLVDAINSGKVFKYITKPWKPKELRQVIDQAADIYRIVKPRTRARSRSLKEEALYDSITTTIRRSLDYASTLQTVVEALGQGFEADYAVLYPVDSVETGEPLQPMMYSKSGDPISDLVEIGFPYQEIVLDKFLHGDTSLTRLAARFTDRDQPLASIALYQIANTWDSNTTALFNSITEQVVMAISQAKLHHRIQRQTEQMRTELEVARQIQHNLLKQDWPEIPGIEIQAKCQIGRGVGGDFYEVFSHPQGDIWLAVGDVSGKGVPAALFMASAISLLRRELSASQPPGPETVMANLNQALNADLVNNEHIITIVLARYNPTSQELTYANAGHIYPIVWSRKDLMQGTATPSQLTYLMEGNSVPLGILPKWQTKPGCLQLSKGDVLLIASDGITEALVTMDGQQTILNQTGLWQLLLEQTTGLDLDNLLARLNTINNEQRDDQTLLSLELTL